MDFGYGFSTTATNAAPEYDIYVEEGTKKRKHKSGKSTGRMDARPSIENAVRATKRNTKDHFKKAMLKEFKKVI